MVHGKEPNHFLAMFQGKLRIYSGGKAGWGGAKDEERGDTYMLQVRGTNQYNTKAEQVRVYRLLFVASPAFIMAQHLTVMSLYLGAN